jgi:hypothetical protein
VTVTVTIRTHEMLSEMERRELIASLNTRGTQGRQTPLCSPRRNWNSSKDRNRVASFFGPGWLMPNMTRLMQTISASIIWGTCGKMADMED